MIASLGHLLELKQMIRRQAQDHLESLEVLIEPLMYVLRALSPIRHHLEVFATAIEVRVLQVVQDLESQVDQALLARKVVIALEASDLLAEALVLLHLADHQEALADQVREEEGIKK